MMMAQPLVRQRPRKMTGCVGELVVAVLHLLIKGRTARGQHNNANFLLVEVTALLAFRHGL
jgi:hypothetical protein